MHLTLLLLMTLAFSFGNYATAQQTDFFWSDIGLNMGATNQPLEVESKSVGDTGSLYLYYSTNGPSNADLDIGAFVDIATSQPGVIRFTHAETLNFPRPVFQDDRWGRSPEFSDTFGQTATVSDDFINELGAFSVFVFNSGGIREQNTAFDQGYDPNADAFLFARVDYEVIGEGCVQIHVGPGQLGIANVESSPFGAFPDNTFLDASFGSALIPALGPGMVLGDTSGDGTVDFSDIGPFVDVLIAGGFSNMADTNCDGAVDFSDIASFIDILTGTAGFEVVDPSVENTTPQPGMLGDVNGDGFIDITDIYCILLSGNDCGFGIPTADVNQDGVVGILDIAPLVDIILDQN